MSVEDHWSYFYCFKCRDNFGLRDDGSSSKPHECSACLVLLCDQCFQSHGSHDESINSDVYWMGPHDMLIPWQITSVPYSDGCNTEYRSGGHTKMMCEHYMAPEDYLAQYAVPGEGNHHYWKGEAPLRPYDGNREAIYFVVEPNGALRLVSMRL